MRSELLVNMQVSLSWIFVNIRDLVKNCEAWERTSVSLAVGGLHVASWRPCRENFHKRILLTSIVCGTNMAAISLSFES